MADPQSMYLKVALLGLDYSYIYDTNNLRYNLWSQSLSFVPFSSKPNAGAIMQTNNNGYFRTTFASPTSGAFAFG